MMVDNTWKKQSAFQHDKNDLQLIIEGEGQSSHLPLTSPRMKKEITSAAMSYLLFFWSLLLSYISMMKSIITDFIDIKADLYLCLVKKNSIVLSTWESKCSSNLIVFCWFTYPLISVWKKKNIVLSRQGIMENW